MQVVDFLNYCIEVMIETHHLISHNFDSDIEITLIQTSQYSNEIIKLGLLYFAKIISI